MRKIFLFLCLSGLLMTIGFSTVEDSSNFLAIDLYKVLSNKSGNIFFSPFSISSALAMTYMGADGNTAAQMRKVLYFDLEEEALHDGFSKLMDSLNQPNENYQLSIANSIWAQFDYPFFKEFIERLQSYYQAGLNYVDFVNRRDEAREKINKWVEEKTNQKIKDIIKPDDIDGLTRLVLVNAIYYKGVWLEPFDPSLTSKEEFYINQNESKEVDMMFRNLLANYAENSSVQVLELPYAGNQISMIVVLPKKGKDLKEIEKDISLELLKKWKSEMRKTSVDVYLPKFKTECRFNLKGTLMGMGMVDAFTDAADFSRMDGTRLLKIKDVIHQSFVEVNEQGTEAAAATAVIIGIKMAPTMPVVFKADRPFIFFIYDNLHDLILFMGRLSNP